MQGYNDNEVKNGNLYFATVNANPVDSDSMLGVFPVLTASKRPSIAIAITCDGVHFSYFHDITM